LSERSDANLGDAGKGQFMREMLSLRGAHVRALLCVLAPLILVDCMERVAFAQDQTTTTTTIESPPKRTFGEKGDVIFPLAGVSLDPSVGAYSIGPLAFNYGSSNDGLGGRSNTSGFLVDPSLDVFVARHFSFGGTVLASYVNSVHRLAANEDPTQTYAPGSAGSWTLGLLPRVGYAIALSEHVAFWPRVAGGITASNNFGDNNPGPTPTPFAFEAIVDAPIIYRIDRRFFASLSPRVTLQGAPQMSASGQSFFDVSFGSDVSIGFVL
jgi:hypothetical protein